MNLRCFIKCLAPVGVGLFAAALWAGDVALSDGQNAEDVVGQTDAGGAGVFTQGTPFNSKTLKGFNLPYAVSIDTVSHRLFVADRSSQRITEYDLDSSNALVDLTADHVLGQTNFFGKLAATAQNRLYSPGQPYFDAGSNRLFVPDYSNCRVLIFDVAAITDGENAVNILGQANYTAATAGTAINKMNTPNYTLFDPGTNRLFVSEYSNNRVTVFDLTSITDGENAVNVLGQSNFTTSASTLTQSGMNQPLGMDYDASTSRLFVADYSNRRVMVFDVAAITDGENAINVLGQPNFTTNTNSTAQNNMTYPSGVLFDKTTQRLFVSELTNRILVYDVTAITDGENAVNVLGQTTYTSSSGNFTKNTLYYPRGLAFDEAGKRLYVADSLNNRVMEFNVSTTTITNGENAENVLGQTDGAGNPVYTTPNVYDGLAQEGLDYPYSVVVDTVSHRLFVADYTTNRVVEYDLDPSNTSVDRTIDHVLGQTTVYRNFGTTSQSSVYAPSGLAFDPTTNRLFVSNYGAVRVTVYDVASITDNENAINVLGQSTFAAATLATTQSGMKYPYGLSFEPNGSRLYVADSSNNRVLVYDVASITNGENAVNVLGQPDFTSAGTGTTANTMNVPNYLCHDGGTRLFVSDRANNRILVFDTTAMTDGENAVNVLGQANFTTGTTGTTQLKFSSPYGVAADRAGNRLFIADLNNVRIMVFDTTVITDGENAVNVLGQTTFTSSSVGTAQNKLYQPFDLTFEAGMNRLYVADRYNNRILSYSVGPVSPSTSTLAAASGLTPGTINLSWSSAGDDGAFNNLTGNYRIQCATYTATWSTGSTPANATTVTISTTNMVPGSAQTSTVSGLTEGATYYLVLWSQDESSNWSGISNTTSAVALPDTVVPSSSTVSANTGQGAGTVDLTWTSAGDDDMTGNLTGNYRIQYATYTVSWSTSSTPTDATTVTVSTTNVVPGSAQGKTVTGLTPGTTLSFVLWSQDNVGNWSTISNTTSAVSGAWFDPTQIEVDGAGGGLNSGKVAWGDFDNDGDLDVLASGIDPNNRLRIYKNNGNGTIDPAQIEVDGATGGLNGSSVAWGDYDNDGYLDVLASGKTLGFTYELRVYRNNGNGTINATQIEVDGANGGLFNGGVGWGDFDNDGDLDILANGQTSGSSKELRVYKNNGNGTFDASQIEVAGATNGMYQSCVAWGDYDNDGDLDVVASGVTSSAREFRIYKNNGNGTMDPTPIDVDGAGNGLDSGGVAWGDFDSDGDLDILIRLV